MNEEKKGGAVLLSVIATKAHDFAVLECAKSDDIARTSWMCPKTQVLGSINGDSPVILCLCLYLRR